MTADARPTGVVGGDGVTIYRELVQRSPEWYAARCGIVTASAMNALITVASPDATAVDCPDCDAEAGGPCFALGGRKTPTPIKTYHPSRVAIAASLPAEYVPADNETSRGLIELLAAERVADHVEETSTTRDMQRGIFAEPFARELYAKNIDEPVDEVGFMVRQFDGFKIGYSPDGLVGDDGLLEVKSPRQRGHLRTVVAGEVPAHHMAQVQTGFLVSDRKWLDFVSYVGGMHLWVTRVYPDPKWQAAIIAAARAAEAAISEAVDKYLSGVEGRPLAPRIDFFEEVF